MGEVTLDDDGWAEPGLRRELMDAHGADLAVQFSPTGPCGGAGCAQIGALRSARWSDAPAWVGNGSVLTTAHELGHAMGLTHSARQAEAHGAWRWSRGHYVSPTGARRRFGTIMTYGSEVRGGVFANPATDCDGVPCGLSVDDIDGADAVTTLDRLRFQVAAHRAPATDADGDGIVDAADALPDDPSDWIDSDGDGLGDNADPDDDNDGRPDVDDAFPLDPDEWTDADRDGIGDNADDDVADLSPFRDPALRAAVEEALGKAPGAVITAMDMASLTELSAWNLGVRDLTGLELATRLERLELRYNDISSAAPLAGLAKLRRLNLGFNRLADLRPLSELANLNYLSASGNPVSDIGPLSGLNGLRFLYLSDTKVAFADVVGLPFFNELRGLGVAGLGVQDISALAGHPLDWWLDLSRNPIADLSPLSGLTAIRHLYLSAVGMADVQALKGLVDLRSLGLSDNRIADLGPLSGMAALELLDFDDNRVADLKPLADLSGLRELRMANNRVTDLAPLTGVNALKRLFAGGNRISDLAPLSTMIALEALDLSDNAVADIGPLAERAVFGGAESSGADVYLDGNPLNDASIDEHIPTLESWGVNVRFDRRGSEASAAAIVDPTLRALVAETLAGSRVHVDDAPSAWPLDRLERLALRNRGVNSLAGLEGAVALMWLHAASNGIADLSPLGELSNLRQLDLRGNRISDLAPLIANSDLAQGGQVALDGNPLSEESLNVHVPALLDRGVQVSVADVELALAAAGAPLRYDVSGYFEARLGRGFSASAHSSAPSLAAAQMAGGELRVTPGASGGNLTVSVRAIGADGTAQTLSFAVVVRGAWVVPLFLSAQDALGRQGFLRIVNRGPAGEVGIVAIDDAGMRAPSQTLALGAGETAHFNSADLETGNVGKGLIGGSGRGTGDWRLELRSPLDLEVLAYIRTADGFVTTMHDVVPRARDGSHAIAFFNPAGNVSQASALRLVNLGADPAQAVISGVDDRGERAAGDVRVEVPAAQSLTFTAGELESGNAHHLSGALGDGAGKWRLRVAAGGDLVAMNLLTSPEGHIANLSAAGMPDADGAHRVPLLPAASDALGRQGFVRVINRSNRAGEVRIQAFDDAGRRHEALSLTLDALAAIHFNSADLELGNPRKGLAGSTGPGIGDWRLRLSSDLDIEVLAYIRTPSGFVTSMHDLAGRSGRRYDLATFNPASNTNQVSRLRIVNPGARPAQVSLSGVDDAGNSAAEVVRFEVPAGGARAFTAVDLESGEHERLRSGRLGDGRGKWRLTVDSESRLYVMSLLATPTGHLTNLSTRPKR